jgi:acyl-coenzyme A thioesterase PaaI-like protein
MIRISEANSSEKQDSIKKLLFNDAIITGDDQKLFTSVLLDESKEGWIGIPHGGIAMGALTELAFMLWENSGRKEKYPFRADFRFGGTAARVGDSSYMEVSRQNNLIQGNILINQDQTPYLEAELKPEEDSTRNPESRLSELNITSVDMHPLPFYSNCFVCGSERKETGLKRRFHFLDSELQLKAVISKMGFDCSDSETLSPFLRNGIFHPLSLMALLDETLGWSGFISTAAGAVTVKINFTFYRPILADEKIYFLGCCDEVRGRFGSRQLFEASGEATVMHDDGTLETVISASGQWMTIKTLTEQMKKHLKPEEWTRSAFSHAYKVNQI